MKIIIAKPYLERSHQIRKEYFTHLYKITSKEEIIKQFKIEVNQIIQNVENETENLDDAAVKKFLNDKLIEIDKKMENVKQELLPHYQRIVELRKEADHLYEAITQKYPNLNINQIKSQIVDYIKQFEKDIQEYNLN